MKFRKKAYLDGQVPHLDQVVDQLKRLDNKNKRLMFWMFVIYLVFALFYLGLTVLNNDPEFSATNRIQGGVCVMILVAAAIFFWYHYRKTYQADYSAPILKMLEDARDRHKLLKPGKLVFILFIVLVCDVVVTWSLMDATWPATWSTLTIILVIQAGYLVLMAVSYLIGYLIWRKKSRPLVRNLTKLIEELKEEGLQEGE